MSYQQDENKAPKTNQGNHAATGNVQESLVKKEKKQRIKIISSYHLPPS
ncbi:hypothetical protein T06_6676 [Trichinella sp. T6]|nr:hypothetical protein T06_12968 [Trichinella sp. T6]KRX41455.1 hypothetical protein T06_6676 [Trichinella sp. T6]